MHWWVFFTYMQKKKKKIKEAESIEAYYSV